MAAIQEVLDGLNDLIPTLPPKVQDVVEEGEALHKLADQALDELEKDTENELQRVQAAIDDLENTAMETLEKELESARKAVEQAVDQLKDKMESLQEKIENEL